VLLIWHNARRQRLRGPERSPGLRKHSNYHSVETCHIFVKVKTSAGALPTSLADLPSFLFQIPHKGLTDYPPPSNLKTFVSKTYFFHLPVSPAPDNVLVRHHFNLDNWDSPLLNFVQKNMILKIGENPLKKTPECG